MEERRGDGRQVWFIVERPPGQGLFFLRTCRPNPAHQILQTSSHLHRTTFIPPKARQSPCLHTQTGITATSAKSHPNGWHKPGTARSTSGRVRTTTRTGSCTRIRPASSVLGRITITALLVGSHYPRPMNCRRRKLEEERGRAKGKAEERVKGRVKCKGDIIVKVSRSSFPQLPLPEQTAPAVRRSQNSAPADSLLCHGSQAPSRLRGT